MNTRLIVSRGQVRGSAQVPADLFGRGAGRRGMSWGDGLRLQAGQMRRQQTACILLWMSGGPSQFETFDPKPEHANGGETKAIGTKVPGIRISENLPQLAKVADRLAIVRSMTAREGEHQRASYLMHTAYLPMASIQYPSLAPSPRIRSPTPLASCRLSSASADGATVPAAGSWAANTTRSTSILAWPRKLAAGNRRRSLSHATRFVPASCRTPRRPGTHRRRPIMASCIRRRRG